MKKDTVAFEQVVSRGCGMDAHKEIVVVTIQCKRYKNDDKKFPYLYKFFGKIERS